jgi:radical SAM superfamily enzyme YgiQ (UPF0313 family)
VFEKAGLPLPPRREPNASGMLSIKILREEDILRTLEEAFSAGWHTLKLYFMLGLPTEEEADLQGIADLSRKVLDIGRRVVGRKVKLTVNTSTFVPKPHTPFQWSRQISREEMKQRQVFLRERLRARELVPLA